MSLSLILGMMLRRWYFVVLALVLGIGGAAGVFLASPKLYEARIELLMLPPTQESSVAGPGNPYLALTSSLSQTGAVVAAQVMSPATIERMQSAGAVLAGVSRNPDFDAPVMEVLAQSGRPQDADAAALELTKEFNAQLLAVQRAADAPTNSFISTSVITRTPAPEPVLKSAVRNAIVGGVLMIVLGLAPILLLERRALERAPGGEPAPRTARVRPARARRRDREPNESGSSAEGTERSVNPVRDVDPRLVTVADRRRGRGWDVAEVPDRGNGTDSG